MGPVQTITGPPGGATSDCHTQVADQHVGALLDPLGHPRLRRSGGTASAFITATRSPCRKLVADVVTGKLDIREVASSLPNEEGDDDWLESAPLADSLDDDDHVTKEPAECSAIESEVTA